MKNNNIIYIGNKLVAHGNTPTSIDTLGPKLEGLGYQVIYASTKKGTAARMWDMVTTIIKNKSITGAVLIDTYSTNAFYFAWLCAWTCYLLRIPYFPILRGGNLPDRIQNSPRLVRQVFGRSRANIVISGYLQKTLIDNGFQQTLIPNNLELADYVFQERNSTRPNLLWVRSFDKIYNPQLALEVLKNIKNQYPAAMLTMVGPDKDGTMGQCKQLAKDLGLENSVVITGRLSKADWHNLSKKHDIFINTTNFDNLPVSVMEAMALGMPIVSTNVGGVPFLVTDGKDGILVNPGDAPAMTKEIERILSSPSVANNLSRNARAKAESFDWNVISKQWNSLLGPLV